MNDKRVKHHDLNTIYLGHYKPSHISLNSISKLQRYKVLQSYDEYKSYLLDKITKSPFTRHNEKIFEFLGIIHSDVCGLLPMQARYRYSYFITFIDDFSRYNYVFFIKLKSECLDKFK